MGSAHGLAALTGIAIAVQAAVLGRVSGDSHPLTVSLALQLGGLLIGGVWAMHEQTWADVWRLSVSWWWLPLGALGWGIVASLGFSTSRVGVSHTLAVVVAAQLLAGLVIDRVSGQVQVSLRHGVAVVMLVVGLVLILRQP